MQNYIPRMKNSKRIYLRDVLIQIRKVLKSAVEKKYKEGAERYFKESMKLYGVRIWGVEKIAKEYWPKK